MLLRHAEYFLRSLGQMLVIAGLWSCYLCGPGRAEIPFPAVDQLNLSSVVYDSSNGNLRLQYATNDDVTGYTDVFITSTSSLFFLDGREAPLDTVFTENHSISIRSGKLRDVSFDEILPLDLPGDVLADDLIVLASCPADDCPAIGGLIVVPEPNTSIISVLFCLITIRPLKGTPKVSHV